MLLIKSNLRIFNSNKKIICAVNSNVNFATKINDEKQLKILNQLYDKDEWSNINQNILSKLGRDVYKTKYHPLSHLIKQIKTFFYKNYVNRAGNPLFSVYDSLNPVVTVEQNFDSLLVPKSHVSRSKNDCYYVNKTHLLRAHTSAHQSELIKSGLNSFLAIGDVYRRDEIDSKHYPVFHQCEGVRLFHKHELFHKQTEQEQKELSLFESDSSKYERNKLKQASHTLEASKLLEHDLKKCLSGLVSHLFGSANLNMKWVETTFPFTHPSWELEIEYKNKWYEVLGCGIIEQEILNNAGAHDQVGWAFGLGLERWAMILYDIPDIRLFWSNDDGFLSQFKYDDSSKIIKYKPISIYPQCRNDISFWINNYDGYSSNKFYDIVRDCGGDLIENVELIDKFFNKKKNLNSHCYRITYRSMERTLTQDEVNTIHKDIAESAVKQLNVIIR